MKDIEKFLISTLAGYIITSIISYHRGWAKVLHNPIVNLNESRNITQPTERRGGGAYEWWLDKILSGIHHVEIHGPPEGER